MRRLLAAVVIVFCCASLFYAGKTQGKTTIATVTGVPLGKGPGGNLNRMFDFWKMAGLQTHFDDYISRIGLNAYCNQDAMKKFLGFLNPEGPGSGGPFILRDNVMYYGTDNPVPLEKFWQTRLPFRNLSWVSSPTRLLDF